MGIEVRGATEVALHLRGMDPKILIFLRRRLEVASELLRERIVQDLVGGVWGVKSRRGTAGLAGSVHAKEVTETPTGLEAGVTGAGEPFGYGAALQYGTRAYDIFGKPVLAWPAFGQFQSRTTQRSFAFTKEMIFARHVRHPAQPPKPWMTGPAEEMRNTILAMLMPNAQIDLYE